MRKFLATIKNLVNLCETRVLRFGSKPRFCAEDPESEILLQLMVTTVSWLHTNKRIIHHS